MKKIALVGNPNVGKSTVFNSLTGLHQHTGNWTGKTVGIAVGEYRDFQFIDLPGTYSLIPHSREEKITSDFILNNDYDVALVICDAVCLERNLNLVLQILEVTDKVIVCVNLLDEAFKKGIYINIKKLSLKLGVPVIGINAIKKTNYDDLFSIINNISSDPIKIKYNKHIEESINILKPYYRNRFEIIQQLTQSNSKDIKLVRNYLIDQNIDVFECTSNTRLQICSEVAHQTITYKKRYKKSVWDKILTNKLTGIPIMFGVLIGILYISILGANYPSSWLFNLFERLQLLLEKLLYYFHFPNFIVNTFIYGLYRVSTWVISVMLPPMAIFFPLFTVLEDLGLLPRIAFNLDGYLSKSNACGKQALTMCMGLGCNAVGVTGTRIIDSPRERMIAIITNSFIPCNGRFPTLMSILAMFFVSSNLVFKSFYNSFLLGLVIILGLIVTLIISKLLSKTILKGKESMFVLELPPFRKPQIKKILVRSLLDRTLFVLGRALIVSAPMGIIIYVLSNININGINLLLLFSSWLNPIGHFMGLDGVILASFIVGIAANEIVVPIMLMIYLSNSYLVEISNLTYIKEVLINHNWTIVTAICFLIFVLFHFPCSTTLLTIKKETNSFKWTIISFILPLLLGFVICSFIYHFSLLFS